MRMKYVLGLIALLSLTFSACYPELSVQQYDQLKADLDAMDTQRQELLDENIALENDKLQLQNEVTTLETDLATLQEQFNTARSRNNKIRGYVTFLNKLIATQSSELILEGQFDIKALVAAKDSLIGASANLSNGDVAYYVGLIDADNEGQTVGAYYKAIESCVKGIKNNLE